MRKRIFISSVIKSYGAFRTAAAKAVSDLGHEPIMAETFGASPKSPKAACLEGVRESDVYVGILGARYSKPTVEEYNEARDRGKEVLIFVEAVEREEDQIKFLATVEDYSGGHFRDTFRSPEELHQKVLVALAKVLITKSADFGLADRRVTDFGMGIKSAKHGDSWFYGISSPAIDDPILTAARFVDASLHEEILEICLDRRVGLFSNRYASEFRVEGRQLLLQQLDPHRYNGAEAQRLVLERNGFSAYGSTLRGNESKEDWTSFDSFYIDPDVVRQKAHAFFRYLTHFFRHADPTDRVPGLSIGFLISGTDRHFAAPVKGKHTINIPWVGGNFPDPLVVPVPPFHLAVHQLADSEKYAEEVVALFRQAFSAR